jgi:molybdate transport system substrate-binding protein
MTFTSFRSFTGATHCLRGPTLLAGCLLAALAVAACSPVAAQPLATPVPAGLTVAAAADLQFAFTDLGKLFEQETGSKVTFLFGSSGTLAQQIENGAPVDLFASADEQYVRRLASEGMVIPETEQPYAVGRIALVASKSSGLRITTLQDLLQSGVMHIAIANPDHAPYGAAAKQAMEAAGLWQRLQPKVVYGENVRQALQFVQTGNAEAGIVALSIAEVPEVSYTILDQSLYQPLRQLLVVVKGARQEGLARKFAALVNGPKGRPVMTRYHFLLPGER